MGHTRKLVAAGVAVLLSLPLTLAAQPDPELDTMRDLYRRPATIPFPADNAYSPQKVELGKTLYFDPRLSRVGALACASCHNASFGWEDGRRTAVGDRMEILGRSSPSILNLAWSDLFFWDGRADSLEAQAVGPIQAVGEMNLPLDELTRRLTTIEGYGERFAAVFPGEGLTVDTIAKALAAFERTVVSAESPFDRWVEGDTTAISDEAVRGFVLFNGKANCVACHGTWRFTDDSFHDIGLPGATDLGRGVLFPHAEKMQYAFKTPGLRNIDQRAPYMHDGSVATLYDVMQHYSDGVIERPSRSPRITNVHLSKDEIDELVAFMRTLTSADARMAIPVLP